MVNPYEALFKMQIAMLEGWAKMMKDNFTAFETLAEHQAKLLNHPSYPRFHDVVATGASLLDMYGKRNHDVDVEKV